MFAHIWNWNYPLLETMSPRSDERSHRGCSSTGLQSARLSRASARRYEMPGCREPDYGERSCQIGWLMIVAVVAVLQATDCCCAEQTSSKKALAYFANAADYQNGGAFELAAQEWEKLVAEFPNEPQSSTAWHHLGICNLQRSQPNYQRAIEAFRVSLEDKKLELRGESLINLAWTLMAQAKQLPADSPQRTQEFQEARGRFIEYLKEHSDGGYADQALLYLGDIEHLSGNRRKAIGYFKQFLEEDRLAKSSLRPDALYALAVAYEEEGQLLEAERRCQEFLTQYGKHLLANEVRIRMADLMVKSNKLSEAELVLSHITLQSDSQMADVALMRRARLRGQAKDAVGASELYATLIDQFPQSAHRNQALLSLGQIELQADKLEQAAVRFRQVYESAIALADTAQAAEQDSGRRLTEDKVAAEAAHWLAVTLLRQSLPAEAVAFLEQAQNRLQNSPELTRLQLDNADALYAIQERRTEARKLYERLATQSPDSSWAPQAAYGAAFAALELGQPLAAQQWSERFLTRYPNDPLRSDVAAVAAEALLQQGLHAAAAEAYQKLIDVDPEHSDINHWKLRQAMAHYLDGKYQQASRDMTELAEQLSDLSSRAEAQFIAGASHLFQEQLDQATKLLEASHRSDGNWSGAAETLLMLGEAYQRGGNNLSARDTFQRLLADYPQSRLKAQVQYKLAQLAAAEGDFTSAIQQYRDINVSPDAASFHNFSLYGIVWCLMQQNLHQQAYDELQPLLAKNLQDSIGSDAILAEGICLRKLGQSDQAVKALQRFLDRNPQGISLANGLYEFGLAQTAINQLAAANQAYQRLLTDVPHYAAADKVLYELAWNLHDLGDVQPAAEKFRELVNRFPTSEHVADANYMVAQQLYDSNQFEAAQAIYQSVLTQSQDADLREKAAYKSGWCDFQLARYEQATSAFERQTTEFPRGKLAIDGQFMVAQCAFKQDRFEPALAGFQQVRQALEQTSSGTTDASAVSPQVRTLTYLHGGQCLSQLKRWVECEEWLNVVVRQHSDSPYLPTALFELGYCKQSQGKLDEARIHYSEVANNYRNEVAARARFMLGEIFFSQKDFVKAIPEFQRVMYGFGGEKAPQEIKNWQAKSAFEAARCSEVLLDSLSGSARTKVVDTTIQFYEFLLEKHASHELASKAQSRLGELQKLR
ncbi:MAG: tetratricopeptide repeat protein [Pirellulaceae bacterium]|nr:tetratricopeptide repeat protein [Pirellulaceae bacterium]